ncbi:dephospho-CoA kinase [Mesonia sp. K4-1]|uniref:dephospho-CoA kinase n=1 Tax=Mesonia sp. K4-1 TaxID=2602760 RepID=UPI0011C95B43|nr:dephospho-CoA kinase [Mesonia sp. K4-1]TXK73039.1 dephospho-CoA kinase [Mesonia sp. K4-1]
MKIIGLTGGIGSGKTTVANFFKELGVPIYIADVEAKKIMNTSASIKKALISWFGEKSYLNNELNRKFISSKVFKDKELLQKLNNIVHPEVDKHFKVWVANQDQSYVIYEAAIIFENNAQSKFDYTILVTAPEDIKVKRVLNRDESTEQEVRNRMKNQWDDSKKEKLANFIIENIDLEDTKSQIYLLHTKLLSLATA